MKLNIPMYRALELGTEDNYIVGYLYSSYSKAWKTEETYITVRGDGNILKHKIDISTLAIHFPDMLDSENNPIFASLRENGKGGDKAQYASVYTSDIKYSTIIFKDGSIWLDGERVRASFLKQHNLKAIGIQK